MTPPVVLSHVVAMSENRVIGRAGGLPWHLPEDFQFFRRLTMGHALIMGRKTFDSIGRALPGRLNLVVSRQAGLALPPGAEACASLPAAVGAAAAQRDRWGDEVFLIGGGELYAASMPLARRVYLTLVHQVVDGDTAYPELPADFRLVCSEPGKSCTWQVFQR